MSVQFLFEVQSVLPGEQAEEKSCLFLQNFYIKTAVKQSLLALYL